jgi:hypothetical protein
MPHLTFPFQPEGLALEMIIGLNDQGTAALVQAGTSIPAPLRIRALLDTGCDVTAVAPRIFQHFGLQPVLRSSTQTASASIVVDLYRISLGIPTSGFVRPNLLVTELAVSLLPVEVLIGMDVLRECLLIVDGPGQQFTLGF